MTEAALQTQINNADSNTSMSDLLNMLHSAKSYSYRSSYDSAGVLPTADSANIGRLAYAEANDGMYILAGIDSGWQLIDSNAATAATVPYSFQGSVSGYTTGGYPLSNVIDKFPFASDSVNGINVAFF